MTGWRTLLHYMYWAHRLFFPSDSCHRISLGLFLSDTPHPLFASAEPSPLCVSPQLWLVPSLWCSPARRAPGRALSWRSSWRSLTTFSASASPVSAWLALAVVQTWVQPKSLHSSSASSAFRRRAACLFKVTQTSKLRKHSINLFR